MLTPNGLLNRSVVEAFEMGYRVRDGVVISPHSGNVLKTRYTDKTCKYLCFSFRNRHGRSRTIKVHRLAAFQKYKHALFVPGTEVRHLDGDSTNNLPGNLVLGTRQENELDKPPEQRMQNSITAAVNLRKFTDIEMEKIRKFHHGSYKDTMIAFGITSKGTLHRILNTDYKTHL